MKRSGRDEFLAHFPVSRETLKKLDRYDEMLGEWNQKFNLVAKSTLPHTWTRHFLDSAQLMQFIPENAQTLADLGSGAGFPGIVLSIFGMPETHLIESTGKKAVFLKEVAKEFDLNVTIHNVRVENIVGFKADVIAARAVSALPDLMKLSNPLMKKTSIGLFLKGRSLQDELTESARSWTFEYAKCKSISDPSGNVLIIRGLKPKNAAARKTQKRKT